LRGENGIPSKSQRKKVIVSIDLGADTLQRSVHSEEEYFRENLVKMCKSFQSRRPEFTTIIDHGRDMHRQAAYLEEEDSERKRKGGELNRDCSKP
jgi:hypothetical protein